MHTHHYVSFVWCNTNDESAEASRQAGGMNERQRRNEEKQVKKPVEWSQRKSSSRVFFSYSLIHLNTNAQMRCVRAAAAAAAAVIYHICDQHSDNISSCIVECEVSVRQWTTLRLRLCCVVWCGVGTGTRQ